jgi:DNA-binding HxlR family transcriptional regulator
MASRGWLQIPKLPVASLPEARRRNPPAFPVSAREQPATHELFDLLGRRWTLRILWELRSGPLRFGDLHDRCDAMSTSVLSQRLVDLRGAHLVERGDDGRYGLTEAGRALLDRLDWVEDWTKLWGRALGGGTARRRSGG